MKSSPQGSAPDTITLVNSIAIHRAANVLFRESPSSLVPQLIAVGTQSRALQHMRLHMIIKSALALIEQGSDDFDNNDFDYQNDEDHHRGAQPPQQ